MNTYRLKIRPLSSFCTPIEADTLYGHLCWAAKYLGWDGKSGKDAVEAFIGRFANEPPFLLSDGFIRDELPLPLIPPKIMTEVIKELEKEEGFSMHEKKIKKLRFVDYKVWKAVVSSENLKEALLGLYKDFINSLNKKDNKKDKDNLDYKTEPVLKNSINRLTGTTYTEGGGLYSLDETYYCQKEDFYISLYVRCNDEWFNKIKPLIEYVGNTGYGKRKSIGKGLFKVNGEEKISDLDYTEGSFITLSPFVDLNNSLDLFKSRYELRIKIGKVGENLSIPGTPFVKKPIAFFAPGSILVPNKSQKYFGGTIPEILSGLKDFPNSNQLLKGVVHFAYAFPVGVKSL